jgi:hypothetical protein
MPKLKNEIIPIQLLKKFPEGKTGNRNINIATK